MILPFAPPLCSTLSALTAFQIYPAARGHGPHPVRHDIQRESTSAAPLTCVSASPAGKDEPTKSESRTLTLCQNEMARARGVLLTV